MPASADRVALLALVVATAVGCRPRVAPDAGAASDDAGAAGSTAGPAPSATPASPRLLYSGGPPSFSGLVDGSRRGVVAIRATTPVKGGPAAMFPGASDASADIALGTGFLVEARGVHVVTTDRIAAAAAVLRVVLADGTETAARVVGRDPRLDVALLAIDVPRLAALELGDSDQLAVGEWLVVLGNPFGAGVTASAGILSATGRETQGSLAAGPVMGLRTYLQTDARIHRGNSGGPVLDTAGQVIGVAVATGDRPGELAFAIPIERVRVVVGALRDTGSVSRSWLGATVLPVTAERAQQFALAKATGALVTGIEPDTPASRSALRAGDVILKWNDRAIDHRSLPWLVAQTPAGTQVPVVIWRSGGEHALTVVTEKMRQ
jgi:serine protease Do